MSIKFFEVEKTYHSLTARLYVDCRQKTASITIVYDRRIVFNGELGMDQHITYLGQDRWLNLAIPDMADQFLSRDYGEQGSFMEAMESHYRQRVAA